MGKSRPSNDRHGGQGKKGSSGSLNKVLPGRPTSKKSSKSKESTEGLLAKASALVQTSQTEDALPLVLRALAQLNSEDGNPTTQSLPAINLLAEITLELGDADAARGNFLAAAALDPDGSILESQGGGAEKFLWLAQLSEEGGHESVSWFEKGIRVLRNGIASTSDKADEALKRKRLAAALCGVVEVYMTDLSWEPDAESRCESLITEAILVAPESPEALQTLASVRISQTKIEEARQALAQSIEIWKDLPAGDDGVPDFPMRISLARLLMEVEMEEEAMEVLERLVEEDDTSVEAWYLGGWCRYLAVKNQRTMKPITAHDEITDGVEESASRQYLSSSRDWLRNSLRLYELQDYEDDRLRDHALELVQGLDAKLRHVEEDAEEDGAGEWDWESDIEDDDQEMDET